MGLRLKILLPLLLLASLAGGYLVFRWVPAYVADDMQARRGLLLTHMEFLHQELLEHAQQGDLAEVRAHMLALIGIYPDVRGVVLRDPASGIELRETLADRVPRSPELETLVVPPQATPNQSALNLWWDASRERGVALARVHRLQWVIAGLLGAMLLTVYALVEYRVRRPALRLARASSQLAMGNSDVPLPQPGGDEIGDLVNDFGRMRAQLDAGRQALCDARDALEDQVRARTEELEYANRALYLEVDERRQVETALQRTLAELKQQKHALDLYSIVAIADRRGCITYVNDKFCEISGYSREELLGQDHRIVNSGHHPKEFFRDMWSVIGRGGIWQGEICNRSKCGEPYWVDTIIVPSLDEQGKPRQYVSIRTDITRIKNYEAQQQARAQRMHEQQFVLLELACYPALVEGNLDAALRRIARVAAHMLGCARVGVWRYDATRTLLRADVEYRRAENTFMRDEVLEVARYPNYFAELGQQRVLAASDVRSDPRLAEFGAAYFEPIGIVATLDVPIYWEGRCVGLLCIEHGGETREWLDDEIHFAASLADMTALALYNAQRHATQNALRLSEARFKGIAESMSDWIWEVDAQGRYTWCSSGVERLLGLHPESLLGQPIFAWLAEDDRAGVQQAFAQAAAARQPFKDIELCVTRAAGRSVCLLMSGVPLIDAHGVLIGYAGVGTDISTRKETERMLTRARDTALETLRLKTEFLANVSHEVRTPLHGMLGLLGLLREAGLAPREHEYAELAHGAGESLLALVNNILDFSRLETRGLVIEEAAFDAAAVIDEVLHLHSGSAAIKGLRLEQHIDAAAFGVWRGDALRLSQVLGNLVNNAVKFTVAGGVTVELDVTADASLRFRVQDSGPGITPEYQTRVFEPFVQGDGSSTRVLGGSGLGLAICKQLVERMGGCIGLESTPGAGSCFWFSVPLPREDVHPQQSGYATHCTSGGNHG
ncbi:MAG: PAS domain S-box protein [Gammaproteobacteria bacterium]|nr:PAS domain S-box protein [Gammaproteobacteria bacterium]